MSNRLASTAGRLTIAAAIACTLLILISCASKNSQERPSSKIRVTRTGSEFYVGRYTGPLKGCFPPIQMRICGPITRDETTYSLDERLDMERFSISGGSHTAGDYRTTRDYLYFLAANLTKQRGYPYFTVLRETSVTTCGSYGNCAGGRSIDILIFRSNAKMGHGVLSRSIGYSGTIYISPVADLYYGTTPTDGRFSSSIEGLYTFAPVNAWKTQYNAEGLARDMGKKLGISDSPVLAFEDESEQRLKRLAEDPIERNRSSHADVPALD